MFLISSKIVSLNDVSCNLCNVSHTSLVCPALCSIIEMEVSSSDSPNESSSSSVSRSLSTLAMVHVDAIFMTGLVPHQDHPDAMIGLIHQG